MKTKKYSIHFEGEVTKVVSDTADNALKKFEKQRNIIAWLRNHRMHYDLLLTDGNMTEFYIVTRY